MADPKDGRLGKANGADGVHDGSRAELPAAVATRMLPDLAAVENADADLEELGHPKPPKDREQKKQGDKSPKKKDDDKSPKEGKHSEDEDSKDEDADGDDDDEKKATPPWSVTKKIIVFGSIALVLLIGIIVATIWYLNARHFEKTDDAFIDSHNEMVAPQVAGRVIEVDVDDNAVVDKGAPLIKIDRRDYEAALDQAKGALAQAEGQTAEAQAQRDVAQANVAQSEADVQQAQANLDNANAQLDRYSGLSREAVNPQRLDDLKTAARTSQAQLVAAQKKVASQQAQVTLATSQIESARASVRAAAARVSTAELNLSYTTIVATTGGRVTNRNVQVGDYVQSGQQLLILVPKDVWVTANYKETQLADMRPGQPVDIHVDAFPDQVFQGHVDSMEAGAGAVFSLLPPENATGNYVKVVQRVPVKIVFDDKKSEAYGRLGPGMSVQPQVRVR